MNPAFWRGKRVFVTGHTGFKGSWLTIWLGSAGAEVHGFSTLPPTEPNLFTEAKVASRLASHVIGDVRDLDAVRRAMTAAAPDVVFHLAAQPLVRYSYREPVETYAVNVMGTVHVLEAARACPSVRSVVIVTTDKCYENKEWLWGYRESEPVGGRDPYSNSKACSELVAAAYRDSFFREAEIGVATARAGNVIGGGDWASDRLLPDFFRALDGKYTLEIRFPNATRPWQHVLEPVAGYIQLAEQLVLNGQRCASSWNFGPSEEDSQPVRWILDRLTARLPGAVWRNVGGAQLHEAGALKLDSSKARSELGWRPHWDLQQALEMTVQWHEAWRDGRDMAENCLAQIASHQGISRP